MFNIPFPFFPSSSGAYAGLRFWRHPAESCKTELPRGLHIKTWKEGEAREGWFGMHMLSSLLPFQHWQLFCPLFSFSHSLIPHLLAVWFWLLVSTQALIILQSICNIFSTVLHRELRYEKEVDAGGRCWSKCPLRWLKLVSKCTRHTTNLFLSTPCTTKALVLLSN